MPGAAPTIADIHYHQARVSGHTAVPRGRYLYLQHNNWQDCSIRRESADIRAGFP